MDAGYYGSDDRKKARHARQIPIHSMLGCTDNIGRGKLIPSCLPATSSCVEAKSRQNRSMYAGKSEAKDAIKTGAKLRISIVATTETTALRIRAIIHQYLVACGIGPE